ncbi:MAG: pyruvate dehydrogenase complex dihydrolipoamide acetyltransferase [Bacteroidia bacterium]
MADVIRMPKMSDTMEEGVIVEWHKKVGDDVKEGDILADVDTDKATMELESYYEGTLLHIGKKEGDSVPVDAVIAIVGKKGEDVDAILAKEKTTEAATESPAPKEKQQESAAPEATKEKTKDSDEPKPEKEKGESEETTSGEKRIKASPLARSMAQEKGIDLTGIDGSGDNGRIVKRDIEGYKAAAVAKSAEGDYEDVKVSQMRKTIARRLSESKFTAPHFYLTVAINMDRAIVARKQINDLADTKVSFNDIIIKAAAIALKKHPEVNASWLGGHIRINNFVNIGVAVALDEGLVVPVVRDADKKGISAISNEVEDLAGKARERKLQAEDYEGNTFTISNLGMFGIDEFTAIINSPESCILAVGAITESAIVKDGELGIANIMKVTMSCDHRVVDGAMGARFLQTFRQLLEEPLRLLA